jgi:hypothetical protein
MRSSIPHLSRWKDYGLSGTDSYPEDWRTGILYNFGEYAENYGIIDGEQLHGLAAEVDYYIDETGATRARTPMLELAPEDWEYMRRHRRPYAGMLALGDDGSPYAYDGLQGWFKKLFKKVGRGLKRVGKAIGRGVKKFVKKLPGGKYLVRLGEKIWKTSMKLVKPLMKFVGKYATKLAPVAALIPGVGPAISAAMYSAGKITSLMKKYGVSLAGKKGKVRKLAVKNPKNMRRFEKALKKEARREIARRKKPRRIPMSRRRARALSQLRRTKRRMRAA